MMKIPYDDILSTVDDFFRPIKVQHFNTDERNVLTRTMLKNWTHLDEFPNSQPMNGFSDLHILHP